MNARTALRWLLGAALLIAAQRPAPLQAGWVVISVADAGPGTLREALEQANATPGEDTIEFALGGTIALLAPLPEIAGEVRIDAGSHPVTLDGSSFGEEMLAPMMRTAPGAVTHITGLAWTQAYQLAFYNAAGAQTSLARCRFSGNQYVNDEWGGAIHNQGAMWIEDGRFDGNMGSNGGAIFNSGDLTLRRVQFENNLALWEGGAIYNTGTLDGEQVVFERNSANEDEGGALNNWGVARLVNTSFTANNVHNGGGGIGNHHTLALVDVMLTGNSAKWGGGIVNFGALEMHGGAFVGNLAASHFGGGLENYGTANLTAVLFKDNTAVEMGGALSSLGQATLHDVTFDGNTAPYGGGLINWSGAGPLVLDGGALRGNAAGIDGGAIINYGELSVKNAAIAANQAKDGSGGGIWNGGTLSVYAVTLSGNRAGQAGGGLANLGGSGGVRNATFSGNTAGVGGAVFNAAELVMAYVTLAYNGATDGAALANAAPGRLEIAASIAAYSQGGGNCSGLAATGIHNLSDDKTCPAGFEMADPRLGALGNHGGPAQTHRLLPGSPAIDRNRVETCEVPDDQRGAPRPLGPGCDAGAVEFDEGTLAIDVVPKSAANRIDPAGAGRVTVAVISTSQFSAPTALSWNTLSFGRTGWERSLNKTAKGTPACSAIDVNGDGRRDLVCSFWANRTGLKCGDTLAVLRARTPAGEWWAGSDTVSVVCR